MVGGLEFDLKYPSIPSDSRFHVWMPLGLATRMSSYRQVLYIMQGKKKVTVNQFSELEKWQNQDI